MKIKILTILLLTFFLWGSRRACAQVTRRPLTAAYVGKGAYSLHHNDVFSFTVNQASLAQLKNASAGIYGERRFLLEELSLYNIVFGLPTHSGNFGLTGSYYGFSIYNETQLGLAYARKLGSKTDLGIQFDYSSIHMSGYGNANAINFQIGTIFHLSDKLHAGLHVYNPVGGKIGQGEEEKLASVYRMGMGYEPSEKFFVSAEVEKEENQPVNVNVGLQYKFLSRLLARVGIVTSTSTAYVGFGFEWKDLRFDIAAGYHPQLGIIPGLLLIYSPIR